jgi:hypothetical protein
MWPKGGGFYPSVSYGAEIGWIAGGVNVEVRITSQNSARKPSDSN